jgi:hypothetical protein
MLLLSGGYCVCLFGPAKVDEHKKSDALNFLMIVHAIGTCIGAAWLTVRESRLQYVDAVCSKVKIIEAHNPTAYAERLARGDDARSRLTAVRDQNGLGDLQPLRDFF